MSRYRIKREREYPLPHDHFSGVCVNMADDRYTHWIELMQDEARTPASYYTNPEHASFAEYNGPNCSPDSEVNHIFTEIRFTMAPLLLNDRVGAVRVCFMPINLAFEDGDAVDELTSVKVNDVLELTSESTDRQTYPLFDNTKFTEKYSQSDYLGADVPNLTTDQGQEEITFDMDLYYDAIKYYTIADKIKAVTGGMRWLTLSENHPTRRVLIHQKSKTKRMNPYTYKGVLWGVPKAGSKYQIPISADVTSGVTMVVEQQTRFLEWNDMFHSERA